MNSQNKVNISSAETVEAMSRVLDSGDDVLIHASLGRLGHLEAGIDNLIDAIVQAVSPGGTVIMMTDTRSFAATGRFSLQQPSETGLLTERFRLFDGVKRSCVPMVSFCAIGPNKDFYTEKYHSHLDKTSTIARLLENDGKIMLMGVGYEKCTLYHLAEERVGVPYNGYKEFKGVLQGDSGESPISQRYYVRVDMGTKKDPSIAGRMLEHEGKVNTVTLGSGEIRVFKARSFDECCMRVLKDNLNAFIISG